MAGENEGLGADQGGAPADMNDPELRGTQGSTVSSAESATEPAATPDPAPPPDSGVQPAEAAPANGWSKSVEQFYGYKFPQGVDNDQAAIAHLVKQARQSEEGNLYAQLGRQLAPRADEINQYLRDRQQPKAPSEWDKPAFDRRWAALLEEGPGGVLVGKHPNVPQEVVQAANAYVDWDRRVRENPEGYQEHLFETKFSGKVKAMVQAEREQIEGNSRVQSILSQNASWLYARDDQGQYAYGHDGRPQLSPAGTRWASLVENARQMGVADPSAQDRYARQILSLELQASAIRQDADRKPSPQSQQAATRPNVNAAQTQRPSDRRADPAATEPSSAGLSLREMMLKNAEAEGLSDNDFKELYSQ